MKNEQILIEFKNEHITFKEALSLLNSPKCNLQPILNYINNRIFYCDCVEERAKQNNIFDETTKSTLGGMKKAYQDIRNYINILLGDNNDK